MNDEISSPWTPAQQQHLDAVTWESRLNQDQLITRFVEIDGNASSGWEPVTYDTYSEDTGWSYKAIDAESLDAFYFYRHKATGKMYRRNQQRRIWTWGYKHN